MLKYLHKSGCPWDETAHAMAYYYNHSETEYWLLSQGCPIYLTLADLDEWFHGNEGKEEFRGINGDTDAEFDMDPWDTMEDYHDLVFEKLTGILRPDLYLAELLQRMTTSTPGISPADCPRCS